MKVSLNWIKDYVDLPRDMDLTRLAYDLTMSTVEVEGATDLARQFDHMLVGQITEVCPHPNADKLQICRTDIGGGDIRIAGGGGRVLATGGDGQAGPQEEQADKQLLEPATADRCPLYVNPVQPLRAVPGDRHAQPARRRRLVVPELDLDRQRIGPARVHPPGQQLHPRPHREPAGERVGDGCDEQVRRRGQREPRHVGVLAGGADKGIFFLSHDRHPATPSGAPGMGAFPIPLVLRTTSGPSLSLGFIVVGNSLPSRAAGPR